MAWLCVKHQGSGLSCVYGIGSISVRVAFLQSWYFLGLCLSVGLLYFAWEMEN